MNLNGLKSFIFEDEPTAPTPQAAPPTPAAAPVTGYAAPVAFAPTSVPIGDTPNFVEVLRGHFPESPSHSLVEEFHATIESLADAIPEEGSRFRAALKVLGKRMPDLTADKLALAYQSYLAILQDQAQKFKTTIGSYQSKEIGARDEQIKIINTQIEAKNAEIKVLMDQRDGLAVDKSAAQTKANQNQVGFDGSVASLSNEINDRINKVKLYLPAATAK